jgi:hypothetical protein
MLGVWPGGLRSRVERGSKLQVVAIARVVGLDFLSPRTKSALEAILDVSQDREVFGPDSVPFDQR